LVETKLAVRVASEPSTVKVVEAELVELKEPEPETVQPEKA
jgi:hypothetical protein